MFILAQIARDVTGGAIPESGGSFWPGMLIFGLIILVAFLRECWLDWKKKRLG